MNTKALAAVVAALLVAGNGGTAQAQTQTQGHTQTQMQIDSASLPPTRSSEICAPDSRPLYLQCAYIYDQNQLRRGVHGERVDRQRLGGPFPMQGMVFGDSAKEYARRYEQLTWIAAPFRTLGALALGTSFLLYLRHCNTPGCTNDNRRHTARVWGTVGLGLEFLSVPITGAAKSDLMKAIWWNNSTLITTKR